MTLPDLEPESWMDKQIWRSTFRTLRRSSSFEGPTMGASVAIAASNLAVISDVVVIIAVVGGWWRVG